MHDFEKHWNKNINVEIPTPKKVVAENFLKPLFNNLHSESPILLLDAGCGDGVHIDILSSNNKSLQQKSVIGLDISLSAILSSRKRGKLKTSFVQGDICRLPFENNIFNAVFSFGVLSYTKDPSHAFSELYRVTREGGFIGIWLYPQRRDILHKLFHFVRKVCSLTGPIGSRILADIIIPFLGFLPTRSKVSLLNASWKQCREVVLVNIAPRRLVFFKREDILAWLDKHNVRIVWEDFENPITIWGQKNL